MIHKCDFAVITPLPEEWHAVVAHLDERDDVPLVFPTAVGKIGRYKIVVRMLPETGQNTTADVTRQVVIDWSPRWIAIVGVAGGFGKKVKLGDVVVASRIYGYEI